MKHLRLNRILWISIGFLALLASAIGIINQSIYDNIVSTHILPGTISQDTMTLILSIIIIYTAWKSNHDSLIKPIIALSITSYIFYAYAIYSIEQLYNELYLVYLWLTALSFYTIVFGLISINPSKWNRISFPNALKKITIGFSIVIVVLFTVLWTSQLIPLMLSGHKEEFTFSIYILDLVFIMPAFIITSYLVYINHPYGVIISPILFFKAFTLLFSVGIGYYYRIFYGLEIVLTEGLFYIIISMIFLIISMFQFRFISSSLNKNNKKDISHD